MKPVTIGDYRNAARARLPKFLFEYADGGALGEETLVRNTSDLKSVVIRQRVMRDVSTVDASTSFSGRRAEFLSLLRLLAWPASTRRGERKAVRAANEFGVPFTLSTMSVCALDEVAMASRQPFWFQLYMIRDRVFMQDLLAMARKANCSALVFTVDMPVAGVRYRDRRTGPFGLSGTCGRDAAHGAGSYASALGG